MIDWTGSRGKWCFAQLNTHVHNFWHFLERLCWVFFFMCFGCRPLACSSRFFCLLWNSEVWEGPSIHHHTITRVSLLCCWLPFPSLPLSWPHYSSLAPPELLWQLIISWHKAERQRLQPPHPAAPWARKVTTFTFRAQIGPARCHQAEMQGQQLFPVQPPPLCLPPLALFHSVLLSLSQPLSRLLNPWHPPCSLQRS